MLELFRKSASTGETVPLQLLQLLLVLHMISKKEIQNQTHNQKLVLQIVNVVLEVAVMVMAVVKWHVAMAMVKQPMAMVTR